MKWMPQNSLNAVNDRLTVEESYIGGAKDVLIKMKQLTLQGANECLAVTAIVPEIDELVSEMKNLANGTDGKGNFLADHVQASPIPRTRMGRFAIRATFRPNIDYTDTVGHRSVAMARCPAGALR